MKKNILCFAVFMVCIINQACATRLFPAALNGSSGCRLSGKGCITMFKISGALGGDGKYSTSGVFSMTFNEDEMTASDKQRFSATYYFEDTDFYVDDEACTALKAPRGLKIPKGRFKITKKKQDVYCRIWEMCKLCS